MTSTVSTTPFLPDAGGVTDLEDWGLLEEATGSRCIPVA
jgi:hypothetical protein